MADTAYALAFSPHGHAGPPLPTTPWWHAPCPPHLSHLLAVAPRGRYILAFSLIMLNTDAHSESIENKMTLQQFLSNNRGIDDGSDLSEALMTSLYHSIAKNEIRMEQVGPLPHISRGLVGSPWRASQARRLRRLRGRGSRRLRTCKGM